MNIENQLFNEFSEYIKSKVKYDIKIVHKTPKKAYFPTIVLKESNNRDSINGKTLTCHEYVNNMLYTIEIYTKDIIVEKKRIPSREIMWELKLLVFEFFRQVGFERISCEKGDYADFDVDRTIIVEQAQMSSWNKNII